MWTAPNVWPRTVLPLLASRAVLIEIYGGDLFRLPPKALRLPLSIVGAVHAPLVRRSYCPLVPQNRNDSALAAPALRNGTERLWRKKRASPLPELWSK